MVALEEHGIEDDTDNVAQPPPLSCWRQIRQFFRRKSKDTIIANARACCNLTLETLQHKINTMRDNVQCQQVNIAAAMQTQSIPTALQCLRKKKRYEAYLEKLQTQRFNVEHQLMSLNESVNNREIFVSMQKVNTALRQSHSRWGVSDVERTFDTLQEGVDDTLEISDALTQPMDDMYDEADLLAELGVTPPRPPSESQALAVTLPVAPTDTPAVEEHPPVEVSI